MGHRYWPLFDLRIRTPRLELRYPTDDDLVALAELASQGVHEQGYMPFLTPWSTRPSPELERGVLQYHWRRRAEWDVNDWSLEPVTVVDGEIAGSQAISGNEFPRRRTCITGSWLGRRFHGRGIGKEMRAAVLHFAFAGLGALRCESGAWEDNAASLGVSRSLGYSDNGDRVLLREGERTREIELKLERSAWEDKRRDDIDIVGLHACLPLFGLAPDLTALPASPAD